MRKPLKSKLSLLPNTKQLAAMTPVSLMVEHILDDAIFHELRAMPKLASRRLLRALASSLREVTAGDAGERAAARQKFIDAFAGTSAQPLCGPAFDGAGDKGPHYFQLLSMGAPPSTVDVNQVSPVHEAVKYVYACMLPSGLQQTHASLVAILRTNQHLLGGALRYNAMLEAPVIGGQRLDDASVGALRERVERAYGLTFGKDEMNAALLQVASENRFHPVVEYLRALRWDGVPRIERLVLAVLKAKDTPLIRAMLRKWLISAVARALRPGCKVDTVLILLGQQGFRKSGFFKAMAGEEDWFSDTAFNMRDKDSLLALRMAWIYEWAELETLRRAKDARESKSFITSTVDTFRPPYATWPIKAPRHCVFVGTTNDRKFLADATGSRRYWVVEVQDVVDVALAGQLRDQLWAEAVAAYDGGEPWWLSAEEEAQRAQENERYEHEDAWEEQLVHWLARNPKPFTMSHLLHDCFCLAVDKQDKAAQMRAGDLLRKLGYDNEMRDKDRTRLWTCRPVQEEGTGPTSPSSTEDAGQKKPE